MKGIHDLVLKSRLRISSTVLALATLAVAGVSAADSPNRGAAAGQATVQRSARPVLLTSAIGPAAQAALADADDRVRVDGAALESGARTTQAQIDAVAARNRAARAAAAALAHQIAVRNRDARAAAAAAKARQVAELNRISRSAARDPKGVARVLAARHGWGTAQFRCLDLLWTKESNWSVHEANSTSSAYGIPQALPGSRMASAGADWRDNPVTQITWGLGYIADRYGSPCAAWAHSQAHNWY